jgi:hypothetical protein
MRDTIVAMKSVEDSVVILCCCCGFCGEDDDEFDDALDDEFEEAESGRIRAPQATLLAPDHRRRFCGMVALENNGDDDKVVPDVCRSLAARPRRRP